MEIGTYWPNLQFGEQISRWTTDYWTNGFFPSPSLLEHAVFAIETSVVLLGEVPSSLWPEIREVLLGFCRE